MESPLDQAIALYKRGEKQQAAALFAEFVAIEPLNETAWLWMAACAEKPDLKRSYLARALMINPQNEKAQLAMARLLPAEEPELDDLAAPPVTVEDEIRSSRELESILGMARLAEENRDYQQVYGYYSTALELDPASQEAWIGKGIAAGMLSNFHKTNTNEVRQCLWDQVIIRGRSGITRENFLEGIDAQLLKRLINGFAMTGSRLVEILDGIDFTSEKNILRVLELDRESLALYDCAFFLTRFQGEDYYKRPDWHDMVKITRHAIRRVEYGLNVLGKPPDQLEAYVGLALKSFLFSRLATNESFLNEIRKT